MGTNVTGIWDPMGHARFCGLFGVLLEFLVGEIFFGHLEYSSCCLMWVVWMERNWRSFEAKEKSIVQLQALC